MTTKKLKEICAKRLERLKNERDILQKKADEYIAVGKAVDAIAERQAIWNYADVRNIDGRIMELEFVLEDLNRK